MTKEINLGKGYVAVVDDVDADLALFDWRPLIIKRARSVYAVRNITIDGKLTMETLHRVVLSRKLDRALVSAERCDHESNNGLDCTRRNLRLATVTQNNQNSPGKRDSKSGLKGAYQVSGGWMSRIQANKQSEYLGSFKTKLDAHRAYCIAALKHHGEYANFGTNSPFKPADFMDQQQAA